MKVGLDVFYTPIFMKKNRPAYKLSVLGYTEDEERFLDIIFKHTTSIGIRKYFVDRVILDRKIIEFDSSLGKAKIKIVKYKDELFYYPEYEYVKEIAIKQNLSIIEVANVLKSEVKKRNILF